MHNVISKRCTTGYQTFYRIVQRRFKCLVQRWRMRCTRCTRCTRWFNKLQCCTTLSATLHTAYTLTQRCILCCSTCFFPQVLQLPCRSAVDCCLLSMLCYATTVSHLGLRAQSQMCAFNLLVKRSAAAAGCPAASKEPLSVRLLLRNRGPPGHHPHAHHVLPATA